MGVTLEDLFTKAREAREAEKRANKDAFQEVLKGDRVNISVNDKKSLYGANTVSERHKADNRAVYRLEKEQKRRKNLDEMYHTYQESIKRAGSLRSEILKDIQKGEASSEILLKAAECISLMTGDTAFYNQVKRDLKAIYGEGLGDKAITESSIAEAEKRLQMLEKALQRDGIKANDKARLQRAEREHKAEIKRLRGLI